MGEVGFEPTIDRNQTDLQSVTLNHSVILPCTRIAQSAEHRTENPWAVVRFLLRVYIVRSEPDLNRHIKICNLPHYHYAIRSKPTWWNGKHGGLKIHS